MMRINVQQTQLVSEIGLKLPGSEGSLTGLGTGIMVDSEPAAQVIFSDDVIFSGVTLFFSSSYFPSSEDSVSEVVCLLGAFRPYDLNCNGPLNG